MEGSSNVFCIQRMEGSLVMFFTSSRPWLPVWTTSVEWKGHPFCKSRPGWHLLVVPPVNWGEWKCQRHFFGVSGADINHQNSRRPIIHISKWALLGVWIWWKIDEFDENIWVWWWQRPRTTCCGRLICVLCGLMWSYVLCGLIRPQTTGYK